MHVLAVVWLWLSSFTALGIARSIACDRRSHDIGEDGLSLNATKANEQESPAVNGALRPRTAGAGFLLAQGLTNPFKVTLENPDLYEASKIRGKVLLGYLDAPSTAPKSPWTKLEDLKEWGWTHKKIEEGSYVAQVTDPLKEELESLHLDATAPPNVDFTWRHSEPVTKNEREGNSAYPPTHAQYNNIFNPTQGVIIAYHNYGPAFESEYGLHNFPKGAPLPKLKSWSDVAYLTWGSLISSTPQVRASLKYVLHKDLASPETKTLIADVLRKAEVKTGIAPPWPGVTIKRSSSSLLKARPNGTWLALLGSANVRGVVWLLAQHWEEMGRGTVGRITIWDRDAGGVDGKGKVRTGSGGEGKGDPEICILVEVVEAGRR